MAAPPSKPTPPPVSPDPNLTSNLGLSSLVDQANQQDLIGIDEFDDPSLSIDGILGGLPVAEKNQEYFAVVLEAGDTTPEIIDQTQFKVIYLVDSKLNVSKPAQDSISLSNILQNFERQKIATVRVDQGTVLNNQLAGNHEITAVGSIEPIGGTQIGTGPRSYVTTMSFQLPDQLGAAAGVPVAQYYMWLNKTVGYQNVRMSYQNSGTITYTNQSWDYSNNTPKTFAANEDTPFRGFYDAEQVDSGSAVEKGQDLSVNPVAADAVSNTDNYFNRINILTGSIEGNTRIRIKGAFGINIVTSSVADLYLSAYYPPSSEVVSYWKPITLNIYKETSAGAKTLVGSGQKSIYTYNDSLAGPTQYKTLKFSQGQLGLIPGFSFAPNQAAFLQFTTDFFDVNQGDKIYSEIVLPEETTGSLYPTLAAPPQAGPIFDPDSDPGDTNTQGVLYFTESLSYWRDTAALRQYGYFGGLMIVQQETPPGNLFLNGITGVTASYYTSSAGSDPIQTVWNYTGSYFIGYNNFSSSEEGIGSYITASTPLTNFYGGDYIQVNPGTETYNLVNAESSVTSSLYEGGLTEADKKTWINFGFNPIRLPFAPIAGDFIRFEYSKDKVFLITGVNSSGNALKLKLNRQMPASTVLDNFMIYRIVEDGQYLILDVKKNNEAGVTQAFSGVISAQYPSEALQERSDKLIFDLKQAGIIQDQAYLGG